MEQPTDEVKVLWRGEQVLERILNDPYEELDDIDKFWLKMLAIEVRRVRLARVARQQARKEQKRRKQRAARISAPDWQERQQLLADQVARMQQRWKEA